MKVVTSVTQLSSLGYKVVEPAKPEDLETGNARQYTYLGKYSVPALGMEGKSLFIRAFVISFLTLGLAILLSPEIRQNLKGRKIDTVFLKQDEKPGAVHTVGTSVLNPSNPVIPQGSYFAKAGENKYEFRAEIFSETMQACKRGYKCGDTVVTIEQDPVSEVFHNPDPLPPATKTYKTRFNVVNKDTFQALIDMKNAGHNPVGINLANRYVPGGGVIKGCPAQEEALCRRSNHYPGLIKQPYPLPEFGGIYCPSVQVFRDTEDKGFAFLEKPVEVALVATAAYELHSNHERPHLGLPVGKLDESTVARCEKYTTGMKNKIRNMLTVMAAKGHTHLVLGALGCGAFANPPALVAKLFAEVLAEKPFQGRFEQVDFAILVVYPKDQENLDQFKKVFEPLNK